MGGKIWVESEGVPGKGATFFFAIPTEEADVEPLPVKQGDSELKATLKNKRVLILDDNEINRRILTLQTEKWDMKPRATESAHQALEWIEAGNPFDVVILDVQTIGINGLELVNSIRKKDGTQSLPIIMVTSLGHQEIDNSKIEFISYLTKPIKPSALLDAFAEVFFDQIGNSKEDVSRGKKYPKLGKKYPLRILLVEDLLVNQKLALRMLEKMSYRADLASNGLEAIQSVERQQYDLILMDVQMPEMDGLEATRQIRKRDIFQPYIIAMTANAMQGDREICLEAGMDFYISKPIRMPELVKALELAIYKEVEQRKS